MFGDRPRTTPQEFREKVRPWLSDKGFSEEKLDRLQAVFAQSLMENPSLPDWKPGIDENTLAQTMKYLREHPSATNFDAHELDELEEAIRKCI
jgi:response regulator of citrate/malate metabolism